MCIKIADVEHNTWVYGFFFSRHLNLLLFFVINNLTMITKKTKIVSDCKL